VSILIVRPPVELGDVLIPRLIDQDDQVRVIETSAQEADHWRALGAHIASAPDIDDDLIDRAAQNVRTIVLFDPDVLEVTLEGAVTARVSRVILCCPTVSRQSMTSLEKSGLEYVVVETGRWRKPPVRVIAEAIDAADDLAGHPKLVVRPRG
jgi:hypothetical protein